MKPEKIALHVKDYANFHELNEEFSSLGFSYIHGSTETEILGYFVCEKGIA